MGSCGDGVAYDGVVCGSGVKGCGRGAAATKGGRAACGGTSTGTGTECGADDCSGIVCGGAEDGPAPRWSDAASLRSAERDGISTETFASAAPPRRPSGSPGFVPSCQISWGVVCGICDGTARDNAGAGAGAVDATDPRTGAATGAIGAAAAGAGTCDRVAISASLSRLAAISCSTWSRQPLS